MDAALLSAAATAACVLLAVFLVHRRLGLRLPPGPRPWPVVGNLLQTKPVLFRCFSEWAQMYGPIMSVWMGQTLNVVVSSPELAREVLRDKDEQLADRPRGRFISRFSRDGQDLIWADYGPHYVKVRKVCTLELFSARRLEALRPIREDEVTAMVESIYRDCTNPEKKGKSLVVKDYLALVACNTITRMAFGKRFLDADGVMGEQGVEFMAFVTNGRQDTGSSILMAKHVPCLRWLFPAEEEAKARRHAERDRLTKAIMEEHTRLHQQSGGKAKQHFVDALLTVQKEYDLSEDTIIGLLWDMIAAGMDTTAISAEWAMAELIRNPRVQAKAQEELDRVIGPGRVMTEADFPNLPYLHCIAKEALRLHPPTPLMLPHKAKAAVKLGGYDVPKGSNVRVNVWAIARDPAVWKDPLEFRPERFAEEDVDVDVKGHDFRVLPFGAGRRVCPGAQLGINLVQSMLGHLLHHFRWEPPQGVRPKDIDMSEKPGRVTYMHTPVKAIATPRFDATHLYKRVPFAM